MTNSDLPLYKNCFIVHSADTNAFLKIIYVFIFIFLFFKKFYKLYS